jgi:hypothetical protein
MGIQMGIQFETVTTLPEVSLTLIVDDILRQRHEASLYPKAAPLDLTNWLNALQRQAQPLVHSKALRENLEAWLDAVDAELPASETPALPTP